MKKVYAVGRNMPGYMPDEMPEHIEDLEEAKALLLADLRLYIAEVEDEAAQGESNQEYLQTLVDCAPYWATLEEVEAAPAQTCSVYVGPYVFFISEV